MAIRNFYSFSNIAHLINTYVRVDDSKVLDQFLHKIPKCLATVCRTFNSLDIFLAFLWEYFSNFVPIHFQKPFLSTTSVKTCYFKILIWNSEFSTNLRLYGFNPDKTPPSNRDSNLARSNVIRYLRLHRSTTKN